jgi:murein L,D-transpeptidase YcbB/YkuD
VAAQPLPGSLSEIIRKRLEVRKPPEPELTFSPAEPLDPNGMPATDTIKTEDANGKQKSASPSSANEQGYPLQASHPQIPSLLVPPPKPIKFIPPKLYVGKEPLRSAAMLTRFYEERTYQPAWTTSTEVLPVVDIFLRTLQEEAEREGLQPKDYHLVKITALLTEVRTGTGTAKPNIPDTLVDLDFLLTDAFLRYGADVSLGEVNLNSLNETWFEKNGETDLVPVLQHAIHTNTIDTALKSLPPQQAGYVKLRDAFTRYRTVAAQGGWPAIPSGPALQTGERSERVAALRTRLRASGDWAAVSPDTARAMNTTSSSETRIAMAVASDESFFDETTEQAVKNFQQRHNLSPSGIADTETLARLNISADLRARQIARNLERWRRLPKDLGQRYIAVNVPNFTLEVVENDRPVMDMKVVVGKMMADRSTPTFSAQMKYVVLNPYWNVPKTIAEKELFPLSRKNPQYFARNNFIVNKIPTGEKQIPDPNATDGSMISVPTYQYRLRQGPGPKNALGRVKFMFPNDHSVYLHDTPSKELFNRTVRAFSHGCIRIEKPIELAEYVLRGSPKGTPESILASLKRRKEQTVWLPEPIPVHIQYWTAWVDDDGGLQFRNDIYGYDRLPGTRRLPANTVKKRGPKIRKQPQPQAPHPEFQPQPQTPVQTEAQAAL